MKKIVLFLLASLSPIVLSQSFGQTDWTLIVYMVGSDLESKSNAGTNDLEEMLAVTNTDKVNVIVLAGGSKKTGWEKPIAYKIANGTQTKLDFTPISDNMATPQLVTDFINFGTNNYPAQSTALVFWNHGNDIRGYGHDENSNKALTLPQIQSSIGASAYIQGGKKFDILGFDACLMASLEFQVMISPFAAYFIASEETEPGHGWNYTPIIEEMQSGKSLYGDEIGKVIVDSYFEQAKSEGTSNVTLGLMNLGEIPELESQLAILFEQITAQSKFSEFHKARAKAEEYSKSIQDPEYSEDMVDIGDLVKMIKKEIPQVAAQADVVLASLKKTVIHNVKDDTRPLATGISLYVPHNVLVSEGETEFVLNDVYKTLSFSPSIKSFITEGYVPNAINDKIPPSGTIDPNFFVRHTDRFNQNNNHRSSQGELLSALHVENGDEIEQVKVILVEEFEGFPNEYILLGSTYPDTIAYYEDGSETYGYLWDEYWISVNGYPAYIKDIHQYDVEDSLGNISTFTRVQIPAIQNPDTDDERYVILSYRYDQDFNITFESIVPETYGDTVKLTAKERIELKPGEKIQLLYESFDRVTGEWFDVVDNYAVFEIENGNEDLYLDYDQLFTNDYHLGYVLVDYAQNDTLIFDDKVFSVLSTSTNDVLVERIDLFPNPANDLLTMNLPGMGGTEFRVRLITADGKVVHSSRHDDQRIEINTSRFPTGIYHVEVIQGEKRLRDKVLIQH